MFEHVSIQISYKYIMMHIYSESFHYALLYRREYLNEVKRLKRLCNFYYNYDFKEVDMKREHDDKNKYYYNYTHYTTSQYRMVIRYIVYPFFFIEQFNL